MLTLLRAGVPNAELLLAQGIADLRRLAVKHNVPLILAEEEPRTGRVDADIEDGESSLFAVRKFTKPPSYYEARSPQATSAAAMPRSRPWRWQVAIGDEEGAAKHTFHKGAPTSITSGGGSRTNGINSRASSFRGETRHFNHGTRNVDGGASSGIRTADCSPRQIRTAINV